MIYCGPTRDAVYPIHLHTNNGTEIAKKPAETNRNIQSFTIPQRTTTKKTLHLVAQTHLRPNPGAKRRLDTYGRMCDRIIAIFRPPSRVLS